MPPERYYTAGEMLRMQRDAEIRVRDMREYARSIAQEGGIPPMPDNRNWSTQTGRARQLPSQPLRPPPPRQEAPIPAPAPAPPPPPPPLPVQEPEQETEVRAEPPAPPRQSTGTILGDVMSALGLGEDTLLIIGLILILINQKADTTLILALAYLLI